MTDLLTKKRGLIVQFLLMRNKRELREKIYKVETNLAEINER
jgi:hypothetical protein